MAQLTVVITKEEIDQIGRPMIDAFNRAQVDGAQVDKVLVALMIMLGSMIRQRGATLYVNAPLREALPPIVAGYEDMEYDALDLDDPKAQAFRAAIAAAKENSNGKQTQQGNEHHR